MGVSVCLAGCGSENGSSQSTESPSATPRATRSEQPSPTDHSPTQTPDTESRLAAIRERVQDAKLSYIGWAGHHNERLTGVDVRSYPARFEQIRSSLRSALREYEAYIETHPDDTSVHALRNQARTLLDWVVVQRELIFAFNGARSAADSLYSQRYEDFSDELTEAARHRKDAAARLRNHLQWRAAEDRVIRGIAPSAYDAKITQFRTAIDGVAVATRTLAEQESVVRSVISVLRSYGTAQFDRSEASKLVESATRIETDLSEYCCTTDAIRAFLDELETAMAAVADGTARLIEADRSSDSERLERKSKAAFESSELIRESNGSLKNVIATI